MREFWCFPCAAIMERMDEQILPAVYATIGASWHARPAQLGGLTLARALVQALASPLGGFLGRSLHTQYEEGGNLDKMSNIVSLNFDMPKVVDLHVRPYTLFIHGSATSGA